MSRRSPFSSVSGPVCEDECCRHTGYYSGIGLYVRESRILRYVLVCDDCGEEMKELSTLDYAPEPNFAGP